MKKYLLQLVFVVLFGSYCKAQHVNTNYTHTYTFKLQGIIAPGHLKEINLEMANLFDSKHQNFNIIDSSITVRSALNESESLFIDKLNSYGFQVLYFSKKYDPIIKEEEQK